MMDESKGSKSRPLLAALIIGILLVVLIKAQTPDMFLNWCLSVLAVFSLLFIVAAGCALTLVLIAAVVRRYARRRFLGDEFTSSAEQDVPATPLQHDDGSSKPRAQRTRQPRMRYRPPGDFTDNGC